MGRERDVLETLTSVTAVEYFSMIQGSATKDDGSYRRNLNIALRLHAEFSSL